MTGTPAAVLAALEVPSEAIVLGAVTGLSYGLLAVGLVLTFRASGVINFAHGQVGAFAAVCLALAVQRGGVAYWPALAGALLAGAALAAGIELSVVRRLRRAPPLMGLVATLGIAQVLFFATLAVASDLTAGQLFPQPSGLPGSQLGALRVTPASYGILILGPLSVLAVWFLLRRTPTGAAMRASADDPVGAAALGIPAARMGTLAWGIAGALATLTAVLALPAGAVPSTEALGPSLLLRALAAGLIAGMASLPVALGAGAGIGIVEQVALWNRPDGAVPELFLFGAIVVALMARPVVSPRFAERADWSTLIGWPRLTTAARRVPLVRWSGAVLGCCALAAAAAAPLLLTSAAEVTATTVACFAIVGLSVWVVTGLAGQLSLGQFALAGIGAMFAAGIGELTGSPALGLASAPVAGAAVAVALGLPALRMQGAMFAVTTLGFAVAASSWLFPRSWALGDGVVVEKLDLGVVSADSSAGAYLIVLAALAATVVAVGRLGRGGFGRRLRAVRDNDQAARALAIPATLVRLQAFGLSGAIAGLGGALLAMSLLRVTPASFPADAGIDVVAMTVLGGLAIVAGPLLGAAYIAGLPAFVPLSNAALAASAFGWLLLVVAVPGGLAAIVAPVRRVAVAGMLRLSGHDPRLAAAEEVVAAPAGEPAAVGVPARRPAVAGQAKILELDGLVRHFGGVRAVDGVTLDVHAGELIAIVGPNGAGKSTLFDLSTGLMRPQSGAVRLDGEDVTALPTAARAARGMVRSFQDGLLFPTLSVLEVVALGLERHGPTRLLPALLGPRGLDASRCERASAIVDRLGLRPWSDSRLHTLSTGTRRIAELACMLAAEPKVMLLDEPTAGLAQPEGEALLTLLSRMRDETGAAIVLIEHDVPLVAGVADRVAVLAAGRVVRSGPPSPTLAHPDVRSVFDISDAAVSSPNAVAGAFA